MYRPDHLAKQSLILVISSARHVEDRINYFKTRLRLYVVSIQSTTFKHENGKLRRKTQHQSPKLEETSLKHHYRETLLSSIHLRQGSRLYVKWQLSNLIKVCAGCQNKSEKPLKSPKDLAINRQREVEEFFDENV